MIEQISFEIKSSTNGSLPESVFKGSEHFGCIHKKSETWVYLKCSDPKPGKSLTFYAVSFYFFCVAFSLINLANNIFLFSVTDKRGPYQL